MKVAISMLVLVAGINIVVSKITEMTGDNLLAVGIGLTIIGAVGIVLAKIESQ